MLYGTKNNCNGECKAKYYLIDIVCRNYVSQEVDSAILFGKMDEIAFTTLKENEKNRRLGLRFDGIYQHIHFIPLNEFGVRQLKIISIPNWKEKLLNELFEPQTRSYECGLFVYDALIFLKKYLGSSVTFRLLDLSIVEEGLGIK